jgi:2-oxo-4-hydroxy-4-carboxy--5-ureidoimidazoline (OHCU) decarboxylase
MAMVIAVTMMAGIAMADSVDIGLGRMDRAEFEALKQMVAGNYQSNESNRTGSTETIRVAEFELNVVEEIRQGMAVSSAVRQDIAAASQDNMVDVGLGSMSTSEFCDLNKLVASNTETWGFEFICN